PVDQDKTNDFAEGERHNREVVSAQAQHRKSEQDAPECRQDACQRKHRPKRKVEGFADQRAGVGADRVKGDVAEVEKPGEADHNVEAPAEDHIDKNLYSEIVDPFAGAGTSESERQDRI